MVKSVALNKVIFATMILATSLLSACGGSKGHEFEGGDMSKAPPAAAPSNSTYTVPALRRSFTITKTANGLLVTNLNTTQNFTVPNSYLNLKFSDFNINLNVGAKSLQISESSLNRLIELYIAFFNRVPDADGMSYWIDQIKAGMTVDQLANNFYAAAVQFSSLTGYSSTMSDADFIRVIYKNVLGRSGATAPPTADVAYWVSELTSGRSTKGALIVTMLNAARTFVGDPTYGWVPQLLDNKVQIGKYFSIQQGLNYNMTDASISNGMLIAGDVTSSSISPALNRIGFVDSALDLTAGTATTKAEGVYEGYTNSGASFELIVLEDQSYWVIYGTQNASRLFTIYGFVQGTSVATNTSVASNDAHDFYFDGTWSSAKVSANYIAGSNISGAIGYGASTNLFSGSTPVFSTYDYNLPAKLSDIAGTWHLSSFQGGSISLLIGGAGEVLGSFDGSNCTITGKILPRPTRKNVFNFSVLQGSGCINSGKSYNGIGITFINSLGQKQFLVAGVNQDRLLGDAYFGAR